MSECADCVEKAKLRNRDMQGMLIKAKQQALDEQKPKAICWESKAGLFIADARDAIRDKFLIRHIVSGLQ